MSKEQIIQYVNDNIHDKNWLIRMIPMVNSIPEPWIIILKEYHTKDVSFLIDILSKKKDLNTIFKYYLNNLLGVNEIIIDFFIQKKCIASITNKDYPQESFLKNIKGKAQIDSQTKLYIVNVVEAVKELKESEEEPEEPEEPEELEEMDYFTALFQFFKDNNENFPMSKEIEIADTEEEKLEIFQKAIELLSDTQTEIFAEFEESVDFSDSENSEEF